MGLPKTNAEMWPGLTKTKTVVSGMNERKPLERWMWIYLQTGFKPTWAHKGIDHQDLRDMIARAIRDQMEAK